ncbi:Calcineurin-like phosphoesterase superfamily domain protein [uncultured archaeon]|nr:Calcineurin-like phosphoesterase superfamily domain protein [uncultured archaeon]
MERLLSRREAKSKTILSYTFTKLEKYLDKKINKVPIEIELNNIEQGRISSLFGKRNIFLISDTHFGHTNIIEYCKRPFKSTSEMNRKIIKNWNETIRKKDIVLFLGDMRFGRGSPSTDYWLKKLNGRIYFLKGSHEHDTKSRMTDYYNKLIVKYHGKRFLLVHDPADIPSDWNGWTICGHHHNNQPEEFPLVNGKTKLINVSVELLNYTPLNINKLFELDFENIVFMKKIDSIPIMKKT